MEVPPWYRISLRRRRREAYAKNREIRLKEYNGDISSASYQKKAWKRLQKSIVFCIATLNRQNICLIRTKLLKVNLVRGKGLFCQAIMNAQLKFTDCINLYADLISLINVEFPNIGELLLTRCILQFKRAYNQNDKYCSAASITFLAHLIKLNVASDILALDLLKLLGTSLTEHSIQLTCDILNICGSKLANKKNDNEMVLIFFKMLQHIFQYKIDSKVCDMVYKVLRQFQSKVMVKEDIDPMFQNKQLTHSITLESATDPQDDLNYYIRDIDYEANEMIHFQSVFKKILKYEVKYCYNSDGDADDEEESEEEAY